MPHNNWDDEHIENLLRDFPAIRDDRPKEEVYQRLAQKEPVRKRQRQWLPLLVAALAFITIGILVASILNQSGMDSAQNEQSTESGADHSAASTAESAEDRTLQEENEATGDAATSIMESEDAGSGQVSVYEEDLEGHTLFTIGVTENAFVIPLSFLIPDAQIMEDFGKGNPNTVELYNQYASKIDEQALGFDEYHPYVGKIAMGPEGAEHMLPKDHQYDLASASIGVYTATLKETFRDAGRVAVVNEDGSPVEFNQIGPMEPVVTDVKNVAFYAYTTAAGETFLAPGYGMPFETATEAFQAMKDSPNDFQKSTLPDSADFSVAETDDLVQIEFQSPFDFSAMEEMDAKRLIESLAMTAKSYGKQVQLANTEQPQWLGYDFTKPLETPVATNNTPWTIK